MILDREVMYDANDADARALLDQGFVVVDDVETEWGITCSYLIIAAPLLATVLLRKEKLPVPEDLDLPEAEDIQDPW